MELGLRQGDPLSTTLFNVVLEAIIRETPINTSGIIYQNRHQCFAFADDLALISRSVGELKTVFKNLEKKANEYGLQVNTSITKYMKMIRGQEVREGQHLKVNAAEGKTYYFEEVRQFEYLGVTVTNKGEEKVEIEKRIGRGSKAARALKKLLKSKYVSLAPKICLYRTLICPAVLYGAELWVMNKHEAKKLEAWERKMLRSVYGGIKDNEGNWRRRTNREILEIYGKPTITQRIRAQRVRWL